MTHDEAELQLHRMRATWRTAVKTSRDPWRVAMHRRRIEALTYAIEALARLKGLER